MNSDLSEVLEDVVDDDLLRLVGVDSGKRVHVDDRVLEADQREAQGAFKSLDRKKPDIKTTSLNQNHFKTEIILKFFGSNLEVEVQIIFYT